MNFNSFFKNSPFIFEVLNVQNYCKDSTEFTIPHTAILLLPVMLRITGPEFCRGPLGGISLIFLW